MEIKNYLFKNIYSKKENIVKKIFKKRNQKDLINKENTINKKPESSTSIFIQQNILKNNIFIKTKTNSSNNIINNSCNFNSYYQSQSSDKKNLTKIKSRRILHSRNPSNVNKVTLNNKKRLLTSSNNTTATSLLNNQIYKYNKCITDRNNEENKIKSINVNKIAVNGAQFINKNKALINNKDLKENNYNSTLTVIPKKIFGVVKRDSLNNINIGKKILNNKLHSKEVKHQNYIENNNANNNIINENILFKKKIKNFKNLNSNIRKLKNNNKLKNQNINNNLNDNKNKTTNLLNTKKINLSNIPINFLDGKLIQGINNLNTNNNINTESNIKKECMTDRNNYNCLNNINSQNKNKELLNEQYNNINNNYIITNIINNIKLNNKKKKKKNISRNKSIKMSEERKNFYNTNLTSLNLLLRNSNLKNYPSTIRIKTLDLNKINNITPSTDYNISFNKRNNFESKNLNKKLFDSNNNLNINFNKRNTSSKTKNNFNPKIQKKGKNYKKISNIPLKLTKRNIFQKEKKLNLEMNFSNNSLGVDKMNLLTFNYIHSLNFSNKYNNSVQNKRKSSHCSCSDRYKNIFQLFNYRNSITESKRDSNYYNKTESNNFMAKNNLIHIIPKYTKIQQFKYMNSLSNYEIKKEKEILRNNNNNSKLNQNFYNTKNNYLNNKKTNSSSPFNTNCVLKKRTSKKINEINPYSRSKNLSQRYKNYICFFNNESKINISKFKTNKSSKSKKEKKEKNIQTENNNNRINSKRRIKNLSVSIYNMNKSTKNKLNNNNNIKENEKQKQNSLNNIFSKDKNSFQNKNNNIDKEIDKKIISVKRNSKNKKEQKIESSNSKKNKNQSEFSKKSRNIDIPTNNQKSKTVIRGDINIKEKDNYKEKRIEDEYLDEILYSLLKEESEFISKKMINHNYLLNSDNEISPEMRAMVVDWLLEVHQIFHFKEKCLFTTIQIIDKFLSKKNISLEQFQLLALTAMNIASKQEEVEYPILDNFITISKNTVTKKEMVSMENNVISTINFEILSPTSLDFFQIYASICNLNPVEISQGLYILNILLIDINMLEYKCSILAFSVLKLITKEENIKELFLFIKEISKKAYKINGNKNNEAQILFEEIDRENKTNKLSHEVKYLFRTILKTHYNNAKNKFNSQIFHAVSSYTSI